jgi:hypothetical protein
MRMPRTGRSPAHGDRRSVKRGGVHIPVARETSGNAHVRFDERGWETGRRSGVSARAHPRLYRMTRQRWLRHTARLPPIHSAMTAGMPVRSTALRLRSGVHQCGEPGRRLVERIYPLVDEGIARRFVPAEPRLERVQPAVLRVCGCVRAGIRRNGSRVIAATARHAEWAYVSVRLFVRRRRLSSAGCARTLGRPTISASKKAVVQPGLEFTSSEMALPVPGPSILTDSTFPL